MKSSQYEASRTQFDTQKGMPRDQERTKLLTGKSTEFSSAKSVIKKDFSVVDRLYGRSKLKGKKLGTETEERSEMTSKLLNEFTGKRP